MLKHAAKFLREINDHVEKKNSINTWRVAIPLKLC